MCEHNSGVLTMSGQDEHSLGLEQPSFWVIKCDSGPQVRSDCSYKCMESGTPLSAEPSDGQVAQGLAEAALTSTAATTHSFSSRTLSTESDLAGNTGLQQNVWAK